MTMANDEIVLLLRCRVIHSAYTTELPRVQIMPFFFIIYNMHINALHLWSNWNSSCDMLRSSSWYHSPLLLMTLHMYSHRCQWNWHRFSSRFENVFQIRSVGAKSCLVCKSIDQSYLICNTIFYWCNTMIIGWMMRFRNRKNIIILMKKVKSNSLLVTHFDYLLSNLWVLDQ